MLGRLSIAVFDFSNDERTMISASQLGDERVAVATGAGPPSAPPG
jgi:hypothetical protein